MHIDENEDWLDDFDSWEQVRADLRDDLVRVVDLRQRLEVSRGLDDLMVLELDRRLLARQRRELYRIGFRPDSYGRLTVWRWEAAEQVDEEQDVEVQGIEVQDVEELIGRQVLRVLREVFRSDLVDVAVVVHREAELSDDEWDEEEEEEAQWSTG